MHKKETADKNKRVLGETLSGETMIASILFVALWYLKIVQTNYDWIILCFLIALETGNTIRVARRY